MTSDLKTGLTASAAARTLLAGSLILAGNSLQAADNPFVSTDLSAGYRLADADAGDKAGESKAMKGEGKCGGKAASEAVCGIYQIGSSHKDPAKVKDGKCGGHKVVEALCGGAR
ncbi:hypothetical protein DFR30_0125 [Thiogranum longum]|uniref:Low-complexity protein n=1 Tax=Thiogranum longum TaxID=1537524 RepID=A0A4V2PGI2_9GAMM|nr:hypothetical protein [Thiogranum longum]TCK16906.1 hypothetical protein DFR30_0125 [Thiogranum longum]